MRRITPLIPYSRNRDEQSADFNNYKKSNGIIGIVELCVVIFLMTISSSVFAQNTFFRTYGGTSNDQAKEVQQTPDGGYIVTGETYSFGAGSRDVYLLRTDSSGNEIWAKTCGGISEDYALTLDQTSDSSFIIGAHTGSFGQGGHDYYLIKTDLNGDSIYTKVYGGGAPDGIYQLKEDFFGGYIMAGHTSSFGAGAHDFYAIKILSNGDTLWTRTYGGSGGDYLRGFINIELTAIPRLAFIGETDGFGAGAYDVLFIKTGLGGGPELQKTYGNSGNDYGYSVIETTDGGFLIAGHTNSSGAGLYDVYLIKIDFSGNVEWSKTYGGSGDDFAYFAQLTSDNGYIIAGSTNSFGGGNKDVYLIKTDSNGDTLWTKAYGDIGNEEAWSVEETMDGGYVLAGYTNSFGTGNDVLLIKTDSNGNAPCYMYNTTTIVDTATTIINDPILQIGYGTVTSNSTTMVDSVMSTGNSCPIVGIDETDFLNKLTVEIYPNPFDNFTTLFFSNPTNQNYTLTLFDTPGRLVRTITNITTDNIVIERKKLHSGLYFFRLHTDIELLSRGRLIIK